MCVSALEAAKELGAFTVAFTGADGRAIEMVADECLRIPSMDKARIQEAHILCGHLLCELVELNVSEINLIEKVVLRQ
jgi:D-sedoheptulose 7-phosphate isomerase